MPKLVKIKQSKSKQVVSIDAQATTRRTPATNPKTKKQKSIVTITGEYRNDKHKL